MAALGQPGLRGEGQARGPGLGGRARRAAAAFTDHAAEQAAGQRRGHQRADGPAARRLPGDRDLVRVTAEAGDVPVHPAQRRFLVEQPVIAVRGERRATQPRHVQEAEDAQPVVDGHHDDVIGPDDQRAVVLVPGPGGQAAAVDHDHDRQPAAARIVRGAPARAACRGEHVEEQAVFGVLAWAVAAGQLGTAVAVGRRVTDAGPRLHRLRGLPAQRPDGRRGVADAQELVDAFLALALQPAVLGGDDQAAGGPARAVSGLRGGGLIGGLRGAGGSAGRSQR